jgi:hypothetical protein
MSRGLGALQRAILQVYDEALLAPPLPGTGRDDWRTYAWLREQVARRCGLWCPQRPCACITESPDLPNLARYPHINLWEQGAFTVAFARAMRTLIRRGVLVTVTWRGEPCTVLPGHRIAYVKRAKSSGKVLNT